MIGYRRSTVRPPQSRNYSKVSELKPETFTSSTVNKDTRLLSTPVNQLNVVMSMVAGGPPTGNKRDDFTNELNSIARIATTMYLEDGLISGTLPVDDVIGELLRIGSVTLKVLESLKLGDLTNATEQYEELGKKLNGDAGVKAVEEEMLLREQMRKAAEEVGDVENLPGADEYKANLEQVKAFNGIDLVSLRDYINDLNNLITDLVKVETMKSDTDASRAFSERLTLENCPTIINLLQTANQKLMTLPQQVAALKAIDIEPKYMEPLFKEVDAEKHFKDSNFQKIVDTTSISSNLNILNSANAIYQTGLAVVGHVKEVMTARNSGAYSVVYLPGYPNGIDDLVKVVTDASAEWMRKTVNGTEGASQSLVNSFGPIGNFTEAANNVDQPLKVTEGAGKVKKVEQVHEKFKQLGSAQTLSKEFETMAKCSGDTDKTPFSDANLQTSKKKMDEFSNKLSGLRSFENVFKFNLDELKGKLTFHKKTDPEKNKEAVEMVKALRGSEFLKTTITELTNDRNYLLDLKTFLEGRDTTVAGIQTEMSKVASEKQSMSDSKYRKLFACLSKATSNPKEAQKPIAMIRDVRDSKMSAVMQDVAKMVESMLLNLDGAIKKARHAGSALKGLKNKESDKLIVAITGKKIEEISKNLGRAAKGINTIVELNQMKESLKPLLEDVAFIVKEAGKWGLSKEDDDILKGFDDVKAQLTDMYVGIDKVIGSIDKQNLKKMQDYGLTVTEASNLKPVTLDFKKLIGTLERLEKVMKMGQTSKGVQKRAANNLPAVISALKTLAPLNLNFAGYNFNSAVPALAGLQTILGNYISNLSSGVPAALPTVLSPIATTTPMDDSGFLHWISNNILSSILIGLAALCTFGLGCLLIYWLVRGFPCSKKKSSDSSKNGDVENKGNPGPEDPTKTKKLEPNKTKKKQASKGDHEQAANANEEDLPVEPTDYPEPSQGPDNVATAPVQPPARPVPDPAAANQRAPRKNQKANLAPAINPGPLAPAPPKVPAQKDYLALVREGQSVMSGNLFKNYTPYGWAHQMYLQSMFEKGIPDDHLTERRYEEIRCRDATRVRVTDFDNDYINASRMPFGETSWIMAQGPLDGTEEGKVSTMEKHWAMIDQQNVFVVAQLCDFRESDRKEKVKPNKIREETDADHATPPPEVPEVPAPVKQVCGEYFPRAVGQTKTFGRYTIQMTELVTASDTFTVNGELFKVMKMKYTNSQNPEKEAKCVTIVMFSGWPTDNAPVSAYNALQLIGYCDSFEKNVLVVCSDGAGRSGCLVAIKHGIIESKKGEQLNPLTFFTKLRIHRNGLMNKSHDVFYTFIAITRGVMDFLEARDPSSSPMFCEEFEQFVFYAETGKKTRNWGEREKFDEIARCGESPEKRKFLKNRSSYVNEKKKELDALRELKAMQRQNAENQEQRTAKSQEHSVGRV